MYLCEGIPMKGGIHKTHSSHKERKKCLFWKISAHTACREWQFWKRQHNMVLTTKVSSQKRVLTCPVGCKGPLGKRTGKVGREMQRLYLIDSQALLKIIQVSQICNPLEALYKNKSYLMSLWFFWKSDLVCQLDTAQGIRMYDYSFLGSKNDQ